MSRKRILIASLIVLLLGLYLLSPLDRWLRYQLRSSLQDGASAIGATLYSSDIDEVHLSFHSLLLRSVKTSFLVGDRLWHLEFPSISLSFSLTELVQQRRLQHIDLPSIVLSSSPAPASAPSASSSSAPPPHTLSSLLRTPVLSRLRSLVQRFISRTHSVAVGRLAFQLDGTTHSVLQDASLKIDHRIVPPMLTGTARLGSSRLVTVQTEAWRPNLSQPSYYVVEAFFESPITIPSKEFSWLGPLPVTDPMARIDEVTLHGALFCINCPDAQFGFVRPQVRFHLLGSPMTLGMKAEALADIYQVRQQGGEGRRVDWWTLSESVPDPTTSTDGASPLPSRSSPPTSWILVPDDETDHPTIELENATLLAVGDASIRASAQMMARDGGAVAIELHQTPDPSLTLSLRANELNLGSLALLFQDTEAIQALELVGEMDGGMSVTLTPKEASFRFKDDFSLRRFSFFIPELASDPTEFPEIALAGDLTLRWAKGDTWRQKWQQGLVDEVTIKGGQVDFGSSGDILMSGFWKPDRRIHDLMGVGSADSPLPDEFRIVLGAETLQAQRLARALPWNLSESVDGADFLGDFSFQFRANGRLDAPEAMTVDGSINGEVGVIRDGYTGQLQPLKQSQGLSEVLAFAVRRLSDDSSDTPDGGAWDWISLHSLSPRVWRAILAAEDSQFYSHSGFEWAGIKRALAINLEQGGLVQGGSTISQQVVKNVFLKDERTLARKMQEFYLTWRLESEVSKDRILEIYLNVAQWGKDFRGIERAAKHYFGHHANDLLVPEVALLGAILPNPVVFGGELDQGKVSADRADKVIRILNNLRFLKVIDLEQYRTWASQVRRGKIGRKTYEVVGEITE